MVKVTIEFNNKELVEALEQYFKLPKDSISFYHVRSFFGNKHLLEYHKEKLPTKKE